MKNCFKGKHYYFEFLNLIFNHVSYIIENYVINHIFIRDYYLRFIIIVNFDCFISYKLKFVYINLFL